MRLIHGGQGVILDIPQRIWHQTFTWLLRKLLVHGDHEKVSWFVYLFCHFFWHCDRKCGQILGPSILSWSSEVLGQGTKTWLYFSTSYQPPPSPFTGNTGSVLGILLSSSPCLWRKPLKMMSSLCEYRWTFDYPMNRLFLPVAFKDESLPLISLDVSKTICACYRLNLCCLLGPGSSTAGGTGAVPCFYLTFDTWTLSWSAGGVKICIQLM